MDSQARVSRKIKYLLLGGGATILTCTGPGVSGAAAQCLTADGQTTTCSADGNPYSDGIVVSGDGAVTLNLSDGVRVDVNDIKGIDLTSSGSATLSREGSVAVTAAGDGATAVAVEAGDNASVSLGSLTTDGSSAPGLTVKSGGDVAVGVDAITTSGDRSSGVVIVANGAASLTAGTVKALGDASSGIVMTANHGIKVDVEDIALNGSSIVEKVGGAEVTTSGNALEAKTPGDIVLTVGSIRNDSDDSAPFDAIDGGGIVATSAGGGVSVRVKGSLQDGVVKGGIFTLDKPAVDVSALSLASGTAVSPDSNSALAGRVAVVIDKGATVQTEWDVAIRMESQTGATLTNNGTIIRGSWPGDRAIEITGGPATIVNNGTLSGAFLLTDGADTVTNNGTITTSYGRVDFGGNILAGGGIGQDTLVNTGTLRVPTGFDFPHVATFAGVEVFRNSGLIDMRNGLAGDVMQFGATPVENLPTGTPQPLGKYIASGNAAIALDLEFLTRGARVDIVRFAQNGDAGSALAISGTTKVIFDFPSNSLAPTLLVALPVIYAPSSSPGSFVLDKPMVMGGLQYQLIYDARQSAWALYAAPDATTLRQIKIPANAQALALRSGDTVSAHLRDLRDQRWADAEPRGHVWLQAIGDRTTQNEDYSATINRIPVSGVDLSQRQATYGIQGGIETSAPEIDESGMIFGATVGYLWSNAKFRTTGEQIKADGIILGAYANFLTGPLFLNAATTYARHSIDDGLGSTTSIGKLRGDSYGVRLDAGLRFGNADFFVEPSASIGYTVTSIDRVAVTFGQFDFDELISNRGTAGVRIGGRRPFGSHDLIYYASGEAVHEFAAGDQARLTAGSAEVTIPTLRPGTYGRATIGLNLGGDTRFSSFVEANGVFGNGLSGGGGRVGIRLGF